MKLGISDEGINRVAKAAENNSGRWTGLGRELGSDELVEKRPDGWHAFTVSAYDEQFGQERTPLGIFETEDEAIDAIVESRN